ncbi:MAG TPA: hypothetical protein VLV56_09230 [Burkholderiales bacterium]|nr:hypothetical protein [Burkholderiales bacterium]
MASDGNERRWVVAAALCALASGCGSFGPEALQQSRLQYNEIVKTTAEEQLLLNIVRLRYTDTPSSLSVSAIAAQFERSQSVQLIPFFTSAGADVNRSYAAVLPQAGIAAADRPTFSLTPLDDQEFTRKLFTPLPLDGIIYLAKTTWPISTVFRLYLENLNWVPNAQTASGPTPRIAPPFADFRRGVDALESLQASGRIVFAVEERNEALGDPLPAAAVAARDVIEAAKSGYTYRFDENGAGWTLLRKTQQPVLLVDPDAVTSEEMREVARTFRLKPGLAKYEITQEALSPFPATYPAEGVSRLDLETRSLLQALYYVSHGIEVPAEHMSGGLVTVTRDEIGRVFDWQQLTNGLFRVRSVPSDQRPPQAHVAIPYLGYWFYIDRTDQVSKATFSLLMELARLELNGKSGPGPVLTLPVGGR